MKHISLKIGRPRRYTDSDLGLSAVVSAVDTLCTPYLSNQLWTVPTVGRYGIAGNFCGDFNLTNWRIFTKSPKLIPPNTQLWIVPW